MLKSNRKTWYGHILKMNEDGILKVLNKHLKKNSQNENIKLVKISLQKETVGKQGWMARSGCWKTLT
jgi:hypothetical protein